MATLPASHIMKSTHSIYETCFCTLSDYQGGPFLQAKLAASTLLPTDAATQCFLHSCNVTLYDIVLIF